MRKTWLKFIAITLLTLVALSISLPNVNGKVLGITVPAWFPHKNLSLGLDLQGGTQLTYVIDLSKVPSDRVEDVVGGVQEVIRKRVDGLGVAEPLIQIATVGAQKHLIVELPGVKDLELAKAAVGKVVQLKFKEQQTQVTAEEQAKADSENKIRKELADTIFSNAQKTGDLKAAASIDAKARYVDTPEFKSFEDIPENISVALKSSKMGSLYNQVIEDDASIVLLKLVDKKIENQKEVEASHILVAYQGAERASPEVTRTKDEAKARAQEVIDRLNKGEDFATLVKEYTDEANSDGVLSSPVKVGGSYVKEFTDGALKLEKTDEYTKDPVETSFGFHVIKARGIKNVPSDLVKYEMVTIDKEQAIVGGWKDTELTGEHFDFASAGFDQNSGQILVNISFTDAGKDIFKAITERNVQKPVAIFLDDKPIIGETDYAPVVQNVITDGKAQISGNLTRFEAVELSRNLNAGAIPAPVSLIGQKTIEATLGAEALQSGIKAGVIGLILVAVFMLVNYSLAGLIANIALIIYAALLIALFKLWPVTLSLAGIAGVVFSLGVAVDANVLIFERMKEEIRNGKTVHHAISEGFNRAWTSIRDSNFTGLIICVVLFIFGSGMIRGFAVTLAIGVLLSLFSAVVITKTLLTLLLSKLNVSPMILVGAKKKPENKS